MVMLPLRKILFSWTATKYCVTPSLPQKLLIVYDGYFCSTDSSGAMSLLSKVTHTQSVKTWIALWEQISAWPGQQGAMRVIPIHFVFGVSQQPWGAANIHAWLATALSRTLLAPRCQISPQVAALPKRNPASVTCQAPSSRLQKLQQPGCIQTLLCCPGSNPARPVLPKCHCPQWHMLAFITTAPSADLRWGKGLKWHRKRSRNHLGLQLSTARKKKATGTKPLSFTVFNNN